LQQIQLWVPDKKQVFQEVGKVIWRWYGTRTGLLQNGLDCGPQTMSQLPILDPQDLPHLNTAEPKFLPIGGKEPRLYELRAGPVPVTFATPDGGQKLNVAP
jgi:hypothetical protein